MIDLRLGDCLDILPTLPAQSVDAVICDPPYAEIDRPYGRMTEAEWMAFMQPLTRDVRRILKPHGSAVFILQPNSERIGRMRLWLWEYMVWVGREWNIIQDVYWWNVATLPQALTIQGALLRPAVKLCIWLGPSTCYRNQEAVLWDESLANAEKRQTARAAREYYPSGHSVNAAAATAAAVRRGGVTPHNVLPIPNTASRNSAGAHGHGAGTPYRLAEWWTKYLTKPGDVVCDPCMGSGTMGLAAQALDRSFIGIERDAGYYAIAERRIAEAQQQTRMAV